LYSQREGDDAVNRSDFQELAELHLRHAKALLDAQLYSGAYYMCGYVVECALNACICRKTNQFDFYLSPEESRAAWSHDLGNCSSPLRWTVSLALPARLIGILDINWESVEDWSPDSRYQPQGRLGAHALYTAITDPDHGVLLCIKQRW
jgi:hypothetical protein